MVEGESSNARERRLKMQADLERMTQRMEESDAEEYVYSEEESESERLREERRTKKRNDPISSESEQGEFEIGVNLVQEEGNGSPSEEGSDETESEEEGEEVNQLVEESEQESNQDEPMEEVEPQEEEEELPMPLESLKMWSWSQEHALGQALLLSHGILQGAHLRVLSFNEVPHVREEDRADLDQGLGWITFLAKGEKRMVTFRQLEILFGFNYGEGTKWNFKERNSKGFGLQSLMECTLPQGPRQLKSGAQC
ncbi:unnamed protein product [Microthlaspi erraticum]|uniref:Uncharacterized protein n=1 Tax=Microthlaspi erraticum TaxID=1685480 RepID=A0A6D2HGB5_9BRAS|nr:unnamed protein product [Microthlaspi erraticum]